jgi:hypothetical protein
VANARDPAAFTTHWERAMVDPAVTTRAILADGVLVGNVASFVMEGLPSVGYWIAREHWSRGIATRALALLLAEVPTRPLYARAARSNVGSVRVLERCGFVITGYEQSVGTERFPAGSGGLGTASTPGRARPVRRKRAAQRCSPRCTSVTQGYKTFGRVSFCVTETIPMVSRARGFKGRTDGEGQGR